MPIAHKKVWDKDQKCKQEDFGWSCDEKDDKGERFRPQLIY